MTASQIGQTYRRLQKYLNNSYWLLAERIAGLGLAFVGTIVVARYLGPENFGALAYALSLVSVFGAAGHMGLQGLVVREIVNLPDDRAETLGTTAILKLLGMAAGYAMLVIYAWFYEGPGTPQFLLIAIAGLALLFQPLAVIDNWFQAFVQAKYAVLARVSSQVLSTGFKLSLVLAGAGLVYFALAHLLQAVVGALFLLVIFCAKVSIKPSQWRFSPDRAKDLLRQGWLVYLGSIFAVIYLKVDLVMLRWLADTAQVGQYAVAAQLSEAWYFVPSAIVASFFPKLIMLRDHDESLFYHRLQQLFDVLFLMALGVALVVTLLAPWLVLILFGSEYAASASILVIHIWAALFIFMRAAFSKWILIENALYFSLFTTALGAVANVFLNYFLIPIHGGIGAAYATLVSYAAASFLSLIFYRRTRPVFWQMARAIMAPLRYPAHYVTQYFKA
ncbi:MAG: flippase [Haliea sp.]